MTVQNKGRTPTNKRAPTQKDVAELAGVSIMAVSTVVTGNKSTVGVSEATRERIRKAIDELHYRPNIFARSLRLQRTGTVGFYNGLGYINTSDAFLRVIYHSLASGLEANDLDILICIGIYKDRRSSLVERVLGQKIDAVIVLPTDQDALLIEALKRKQTPSIMIAEPIPGLKSVTADNVNGSKLLAGYMLEKGHRRFLYRRSSSSFLFEALRFDAFRSTVEKAGGVVTSCRANDGMDNITTEEEALLNVTSGDRKVTAVVCWRDHAAVRAFDYCSSKNIRVPDDVAIAGFDGIHYAGSVCDLTTVTAHWDEIANKASELIAGMLRGEEIPDNTIIPSTLHIGTTT